MFRTFQRKTELTPQTLALIERVLGGGPWFANLGQPLPQNIYAVSSWPEALALVKDPDGVFQVVRNEYTARLQSASPRHDQQWNDIATLVKNAVMARVDAKVDALTSLAPAERIAVRDRARWSILHACMESEYLDVIPAGFFLPLAEWYANGRFPCGWFGQYPQGALAVY